MAGLKGKSGPPGNMNLFKHGLAAIQKRREGSFTQNRIEWRSEQRTSTPLLGPQIDHVSSETINWMYSIYPIYNHSPDRSAGC